jgi:hypothetical protein
MACHHVSSRGRFIRRCRLRLPGGERRRAGRSHLVRTARWTSRDHRCRIGSEEQATRPIDARTWLRSVHDRSTRCRRADAHYTLLDVPPVRERRIGSRPDSSLSTSDSSDRSPTCRPSPPRLQVHVLRRPRSGSVSVRVLSSRSSSPNPRVTRTTPLGSARTSSSCDQQTTVGSSCPGAGARSTDHPPRAA